MNNQRDPLARALKTSASLKTADPIPENLHDSIMQAVRNQAKPSTPAQTSASSPGLFLAALRRLAIPAFAVCALITVTLSLVAIIYSPRPQPQPGADRSSPQKDLALSTASTTLDLAHTMPGTLPSVVNPLADELSRVEKDYNQTADFLAAALPW